MNKTVTVNIGGIVFHIEVAAYEKLKKYLQAIGNYFNQSEGKEEILADIEARIAELFNEIKQNENQVIVEKNVDDVIAIMGEPEQFAADDMEDNTNDKSAKGSEQKQWSRKLYRDPDNRHAGGVCAGLGYYFGINPFWLRLFFVLAFLGWGSGILIYIILWVIIPEAKTTAEKLEMKGEPINVDNISKTIEDELKSVKEKLNEFADGTKNVDLKGISDKIIHFFERALQLLITLISFVFKILGKTFGLVFFIVGISLLFFFVASLLSSSAILSITDQGIQYFSIHHLFSYITTNPDYWTLLIICACLLIGIPIIALVYSGSKLLFNLHHKNGVKGVGITLITLWIIGFVVGLYLTFQIGKDFQNHTALKNKREVSLSTEKIIHIDVNRDMMKSIEFGDNNQVLLNIDSQEVTLFQFEKLLFMTEEDFFFSGLPTINVDRNAKNQIEVEIVRKANGSSIQQAHQLAQAIDYNYQQSDSTLTFDPIFQIEKGTLFRNQSIVINLKIPENTVISFSDAFGRIPYKGRSLSNDWFKDSFKFWNWKLGGNSWIMLENGLSCISCSDSSIDHLDSLQQSKIRRLGF